MNDADGGSPHREARRARIVAVGASVVGGAVALLASTLTWVDVSVVAEGLPRIRVEASGRDLLPIVPAAAILALGAALALLLVRGWGRRVVAVPVLIVLGGATVSTVRLALDAAAAGRSALDAAGTGAGRVVDAPPSVTVTWAVWLASAGLLVAAAGQAVALLARAWPGGGRRFERGDGPAGSRTRAGDDAVAMWDALDRGEDPTR
jgi:uncharacterized membrane protein (TIGR02234 family)